MAKPRTSHPSIRIQRRLESENVKEAASFQLFSLSGFRFGNGARMRTPAKAQKFKLCCSETIPLLIAWKRYCPFKILQHIRDRRDCSSLMHVSKRQTTHGRLPVTLFRMFGKFLFFSVQKYSRSDGTCAAVFMFTNYKLIILSTIKTGLTLVEVMTRALNKIKNYISKLFQQDSLREFSQCNFFFIGM